MVTKKSFINLSDIREIDPNVIYKKVPTTVVENGETFIDMQYEPNRVAVIPDDGENYLVPIRLTIGNCEPIIGLANYITELQYLREPIFILNTNSQLIDIKESDLVKGMDYSCELSLAVAGYDVALEKASSHLPYNVGWENFLPTDVIPGVGYVFIPWQRFQSAIDALSEGMSEEELDNALMISTILHQIQLEQLPQTIYTYFLPVRVYFNEKQTADGYAYFDAAENGVVDLHFFDERWGQVSVVHTPGKVEDLGFFINKEILSYEFLLPEVEPIRHRFELE